MSSPRLAHEPEVRTRRLRLDHDRVPARRRRSSSPGPRSAVDIAIAILLDQPEYRAPIRAGWALAVVGACTLGWWVLRVKGRSTPPLALRLAGTVSVLAAVGLGVVTSLPHVLGAAGIR